MEYRRLGQSDIIVSELAFGAWAIGGWLWGGSDSKDAIRAIETAVDNGMTTRDMRVGRMFTNRFDSCDIRIIGLSFFAG